VKATESAPHSLGAPFKLRELRGLAILAKGGQIQRASDKLFYVRSQSKGNQHRVSLCSKKWICDCEDFLERKRPCKHVFAVNFLLNLPEIVLANREAAERSCPYCGSNQSVRNGKRYNKRGATQLFNCNTCQRTFRDKLLPENRMGRAAIAIIALDLHFKKLSLREISSHLWQIYGVEIPASTIHCWVARLVGMLTRATENLKMEVGNRWLADEMKLKVMGKDKYLWNILDYKSRRLIASLVTEGRAADAARTVIREAIAKAGKEPKELFTDGLGSYSAALSDFRNKIKHVRNVGISNKQSNNRIERFHGTVRDWTRSKRGMKDRTKDELAGFVAYYNYLRPHESVQNLPPVRTNHADRWLTLLRRQFESP